MTDTLDSFLGQDDLDEVMATTETRLKEQPSNAELHAILGLCWLRKRKLDEAAKEFRKAMILDEHFWADGFELLRRMSLNITADLKKFENHKLAMGKRFAGPGYLDVLSGLHEQLKPKTYVEIGVHTGGSMSRALPETISIGIDPAPVIKEELTQNTRIFELTSDDFFAKHDLAKEMGSPTFDLAFIDGLHLWEQALKDFINLERFAGPQSVVVLHDCLPLDDVTSQRIRDSIFYSGDVWKLAACLKTSRPDLRMAMVAAAPTGVCLVTRLNPKDVSLKENFDSLFDRWTPLGYADLKESPDWRPESIPNNSEAIREWLRK
jgi:predicted O-methyltransferase YrrM